MKTKARDLAEIAAEIRSRIETVGDIIAIGGLLREAKCQLRHGAWLPWLKDEFDFSERTAQNYMRAHRFATKSATVADLQLTPTALYLIVEYAAHRLASPEEIALVLKEAAEKRVTRDRAMEIIEAEQRRVSEAATPEEERRLAEQESEGAEAEEAAAAAAEKAEADAILDRGSELPPPEPAPQDLPLDRAILTTFEEAIKALHSVHTKPAQDFKPTFFTATDLRTIADFLQQVAAVKGVAV